MTDVLVLKLGSSVLPHEGALPEAVRAIYRHIRCGTRVVAVVSAFGGATDRLLAQARSFGPSPGAAGLAALVATGETTAVALLCLALDRAGIPSLPLDAAGIGLRSSGAPLDADPVSVDVAAVREALAQVPVVVVPGFLGRADDGTTTLFGRGGSDLTAVFLASALGARCRLAKDVDGLYDGDPAEVADARRFERIGWDDALRLTGRVVQKKALTYARSRGLTFEVGHADGPATVVGGEPSALASAVPPPPVLRVTLLGLGTVGGGVWRHLRARPDRFRVVAAAVRNPERHVVDGVPNLVTDPWTALETPSDVVVEAIGGLEPARSLIAAALRSGRHVVTANKHVVAVCGRELGGIAREAGVRFLYSASVGGAVPAIEAATGCGGVDTLEGVLNGTTNLVLDELARGRTLDEALALARARGFCEADATFDLDGTDAAHKLTILCRHAFGGDPDLLRVVGIGEVPAGGGRPGDVIRLVARCRRDGDLLVADVGPEVLPAGHPLSRLRDEENGVLLTAGDRTTWVSGRGAGRWPTAEAVLADLHDLGAP